MTEALFAVDQAERPAGGLRYLVGPYSAVPLLAVVVRGLPVAQGSMKSFGPGRMAHSNAKTLLPWREDIAGAVDRACLEVGLRVPLRCADAVVVEASFTFPRPVSAPKGRRVFPSKRPDVDKAARSLLDALTQSGCIVDDAQVVELVARKCYPGEHPLALPVPGVRFTIGTVS